MFLLGPEGLSQQQMAQVEALAANTTTINLIHQNSQQLPPSSQDNQDLEAEIEYFDDQQQEFEEENEVAITEELAYLW
jgi:hypothetical protein